MRKYLLLSLIVTIILIDIPFAASDNTVEAPVQTKPLSSHELVETLSCYGVVSIDPSDLVSINFAYGVQVERMHVSQGVRY
jgi:hypothetical protein